MFFTFFLCNVFLELLKYIVFWNIFDIFCCTLFCFTLFLSPCFDFFTLFWHFHENIVFVYFLKNWHFSFLNIFSLFTHFWHWKTITHFLTFLNIFALFFVWFFSFLNFYIENFFLEIFTHVWDFFYIVYHCELINYLTAKFFAPTSYITGSAVFA